MKFREAPRIGPRPGVVPLATSVLTAALIFMGQTAALPGDLPTNRLQSIVDAAVAKGVPGIVVRVEAGDGAVWTGAAGTTRLGEGSAITPDDAFRLFSISKMATAATVLTLVDDGTLSLDDPIGCWLDADLVESIPHGESIEIGGLITQTSGIRDYFDDRFTGLLQQDPGRRWAPTELVALAADGAPFAAPGSTSSHYSNTNYVLLGLIIERATDSSLAEAIRVRLLKPLGMDDTYSPREPGAAASVAGYVAAGGSIIDASRADLSIAFAAGDLTSTAADVARLTRGLFEGDLLSPESRGLMTSGFRPIDGTPVDYGHGTFLFKMLDTPSIGHTREGPGFGTLTAWWPESGTIVVVLTNIQSEAHYGVLMEVAETLGG